MQDDNQIFSNPAARALQILGDRSSMLIMRDVFLGRHRFSEFLENSNLTKGTLSVRLESLVANEVLCKKLYSEKPKRYEYRLTSIGIQLYPWALMVWQWESEWTDLQEAGLPKKLTHSHKEAHQLVPICLCRHCGELVTVSSVKVVRTADEDFSLEYQELRESAGRQRRVSNKKSVQKDKSLGHVLDIVGDRWSSLIVGANLMGLKRFEEYQTQLSIASNILAARLKVLTELGVLDRVQYQTKPARYEYYLSKKGRALYGQTMALRQWVLDHFPPIETRLKLVHNACGKDLNIDVVCEDCKEIPIPTDVQFSRN